MEVNARSLAVCTTTTVRYTAGCMKAKSGGVLGEARAEHLEQVFSFQGSYK